MAFFPLQPILDTYGIRLRRNTGGWIKDLCPVHEESRPSCSINLDTGWIECHACGFRGGALDLIMEKESCDRAAAITIAENATGIRYSDLRNGLPGKPRRTVRDSEGFRLSFTNTPTRVRPRRGTWL